MELKDIIEEQRQFSARHGWHWKVENMENMIKRLEYGTIALTGEVGEFANVLKKVIRDREANIPIEDQKFAHLREELTDVFIYLMLMSVTLGMDLENEWKAKKAKNEERFKKYEVEAK